MTGVRMWISRRENTQRLQSQKVLTPVLGFQSRNAMKIQERHSPQGFWQREKGTENFTKHVQSLFRNRILLFMERTLPEHSSKTQFCQNEGRPLHSSSIQPSCRTYSGRGWITGNWGLNQKGIQHFYPPYPITTPIRVQESHGRLQL